MKLKAFLIWSALALLGGTTACTKASPTRPSDEAASGTSAVVVDAVTGVTLTAPTPASPTANQQFKFAEQPLTLTVAPWRGAPLSSWTCPMKRPSVPEGCRVGDVEAESDHVDVGEERE